MNRIYHTWDKWECYPAGFYDERPANRDKVSKDELELEYSEFLSDDARFSAALQRVIKEWKYSCEHYLSNECMNRIAWLGQASACLAMGLPSAFRGGFNLLSSEKQERANQLALDALNQWRKEYGEREITAEEAQSQTEMNLY